MEHYNTINTNESYASSSQDYAPAQSHIRYLDWQKAYPVQKKTILDDDKIILAEMLEPRPNAYTNMADHVFGHQTLSEKLGLKQLVKLLQERYQMHTRHMAEIRHRNMQCQEHLSGARWNARMDGGKRALNLERMLHELEAKERQGELDFWKDTNELRQNILEKAAEYAATRRRASWLGSLEGNVYKP